MDYTMVQTPRGTKDFLPRDAKRKRWVEGTLLKLFRQWGYREIVTPTMEFSDAVSAGDTTGLDRNLYQFFEREGDLLALRPDVTTPVARVVATRLKEQPKPIRLCYSANVFRYAEPQTGLRREFYQAGVELVGTNGYAADAEVVALAVEALKALGLRDFRVDIGQTDYYDGIIQHASLSPKERRLVRLSLLRKDYVTLERLLTGSNLPAQDRELLQRLPDLRGGREILEEATHRATNPISKLAMENLAAVYDTLESYGLTHWIQVDLGMIKDIEYYTGMVLEAYTADMGFTIGTGGRYDNLIGQFGYQSPATGFALGIERVMEALSRQDKWPAFDKQKVLCLRLGEDAELCWSVAQNLRQRGFVVELDVVARSEAEARKYAIACSFPWVISPLSCERIRVWTEHEGWRTMELAEFAALKEGDGICG